MQEFGKKLGKNTYVYTMHRVNTIPSKIVLRVRAVHRLARRKRWPAYAFAAIAQETPHDATFLGVDHHVDIAASCVLKAVHVALVYMSLTLID